MARAWPAPLVELQLFTQRCRELCSRMRTVTPPLRWHMEKLLAPKLGTCAKEWLITSLFCLRFVHLLERLRRLVFPLPQLLHLAAQERDKHDRQRACG